MNVISIAGDYAFGSFHSFRKRKCRLGFSFTTSESCTLPLVHFTTLSQPYVVRFYKVYGDLASQFVVYAFI